MRLEFVLHRDRTLKDDVVVVRSVTALEWAAITGTWADRSHPCGWVESFSYGRVAELPDSNQRVQLQLYASTTVVSNNRNLCECVHIVDWLCRWCRT